MVADEGNNKSIETGQPRYSCGPGPQLRAGHLGFSLPKFAWPRHPQARLRLHAQSLWNNQSWYIMILLFVCFSPSWQRLLSPPRSFLVPKGGSFSFLDNTKESSSRNLFHANVRVPGGRGIVCSPFLSLRGVCKGKPRRPKSSKLQLCP